MTYGSTRTGYRIGHITACMVYHHMIGINTTTDIGKYHVRRGVQTVGAYEVGNVISVGYVIQEVGFLCCTCVFQVTHCR